MRSKSVSPSFAFAAVLAAAALAATGVWAQQPAPQKKPARQRVGVVDVGLLFKEFKRKDAFEKQINAQRKRLKDELDKEQEKLKKLRREFEKSGYRKGSEPWLREREKLKLAQFSWELKGERMQNALKHEVEQNTLQILSEIEHTIGNYGSRYGYTYILKIDKAEKSPTGASSDLVQHFQERIFRAQISDVLYFDKTIDITQPVLKYLNHAQNIRHLEQRAKKN